MQNDPVVSKCSELIRLGLMPSAEEIRAGKVCFVLLHFKVLDIDWPSSRRMC